MNKAPILDIIYSNTQIKLEETLPGKSMAHKVISVVNSRLKFLHQRNEYLTPDLRCLVCNA